MPVTRKLPPLPRPDVQPIDPQTGFMSDSWRRFFIENQATMEEMRSLAALTYMDFAEIATPSSPPANTARIFAKDNGAGKTQLMVLFPTGVAQQISIEP